MKWHARLADSDQTHCGKQLSNPSYMIAWRSLLLMHPADCCKACRKSADREQASINTPRQHEHEEQP